jgi:two-component system, OmpR family, sensor kinase
MDATDTDLVIRVIDHGPGIDPQDADQIFRPFFRVDSSRARGVGGGAGLGLALTKQIVDRHHGAIAHGPTPGGGATFQLTFARHSA